MKRLRKRRRSSFASSKQKRSPKRIFERLYPGADKPEWWPKHVQKAFANLGRALGAERLTPAVLERVSPDGLPGHQIIFGHQSGIYTLQIIGSSLAGQWRLPSDLLERLARAAIADRQ